MYAKWTMEEQDTGLTDYTPQTTPLPLARRRALALFVVAAGAFYVAALILAVTRG